MKKTVIDLSNIPFGRRLALLRGLKEKKQQEVADELKLSSKNLSKWENSECEPSLIDLKQLSDYYAVSLDFIIKGIANDKDLGIAEKVQKLDREQKLSKELNELLKPYGRFSVEEKNQMFKINDKEILVNIKEVVSHGDIDLFKKLNNCYRMFEPARKRPVWQSALNSGYEERVLNDFPHKLTLQECLETSNIDFYALALDNLYKENEGRAKHKETLKKLGYADYERMGLPKIDVEMVLSQTLEGVLARYADADKLLLWLLDKGACILKKIPYEYSDGYHIEKDMAQTNLLKRTLKSTK